MKKLLIIISLFCSTLVHAQDYKLSKQIANNCMQKGNESFLSNPYSTKDIALLMDGFSELWKNTADVSYFDFIKNNIDKNILNNKGEVLNVNNTISTIKIGETLLFLYRVTGEYKYFKATQSIINQLKAQTRNKEGVFLNNNQTQLESLYITMPLYAEYAYILNDHRAFDDIANQYLATSNILLDPKSKLLKSKKEDGSKANFSPINGEEIGKFEMSLIDVLDYFPNNHPKYSELIELYKKYAFVIRDVKNETFSSTSCNSMFAYSIAKGVRRKILPTSSSELAKKLFEKSINNQVNNDLSQQGYLLKASNEIETIPTLSIGNGKTVLLDHFFNHETMKDSTGYTFPHHYLWNQEEQNGYSLFGHVFNKYGVTTLQDSTEINESILKKADIYIIVDPDNKKESPNPKFINSKHIDLIVNWVKQGGVLLLFANDSSNTELKGLNELASNFGIHFNDKIRNKVAGKQFEQGAIHISENHSVFTNIKKLFLKGICTISCTSPAEAIVTEENDTIMAISKLGKGYVFAVGDPWLYNEYANGRNISSTEFENYKAMEALVKWAIKQSSH